MWTSAGLTGFQTLVIVGKYTAATFTDYDGMITGNGGSILFIGNSGTDHWYVGEAPSLTRYKDGVEGYDEVTNAFHVFLGTNASGINLTLNIGSDRGMFRGWHGYIAEIAVYDSILGAEEITTLTNHLMSKYGLS